MIHIKAPWEIAMMRSAGKLLAEVKALVREQVQIGVTTGDLDRICEEEIRKRKSVPAFKGYQVGRNVFPASLCASPNEQVVHGIPDDRPMEAGELISLDFGLVYGGYHADSAFTVVLGEAPEPVARLLDVTQKSLYEAIALARVGKRVGDLGNRIQVLCESQGFGVVRDYVGHGIGRMLHEEPAVPNFGKKGTGVPLKPGMCIAIEPMITLGTYKTRTLGDGWTVVTADGSLAAHFEQTVLITDGEPEVLTSLDGGLT
jgi:methionyl aminopeptidase